MILRLLYLTTLCILNSAEFSLHGSQKNTSTSRSFSFKPLSRCPENKKLSRFQKKTSTFTQEEIEYLHNRQKFFTEKVDPFQLHEVEDTPKRKREKETSPGNPLKRAKISTQYITAADENLSIPYSSPKKYPSRTK